MTVRGGFFNSLNSDRLYSAADMNLPYKKLISNGVIPDVSDALQVVASSGLTVNVKAGSGLFGDGWAVNDAAVALTLDAAHATLDRIDLIVMRRDDNENVRATNVFIKKGTPASTPAAPAVERSTYIKEYALAEIHLAHGATAITQSMIVDTRPDTTRCGWVTGLFEQVDTSTLFAQWQAAYAEQFDENTDAFNTWWASVRTILQNDETAAAQLLLLNQDKADRETTTASLTAAGWSLNADGYYYQTYSNSGIGLNDVVIVSAAPASIDAWARWGVVCTAQAAGSLTFRATAAIAVTANILNLGGGAN